MSGDRGVVGDMLSGGAPAFKFDHIGADVSGVVVEIGQRQDAVFGAPDKLKWWNRDDGPERGNPQDRPVMIPIFTLRTSLRDSEEDDGLRSLWARGHMFSAIRDAIKAGLKGRHGVGDADVLGGTLHVQHYGLGKPKVGNPPKLFRAKFVPKPIATGDSAAAQDDELEPVGETAPPPANW